MTRWKRVAAAVERLFVLPRGDRVQGDDVEAAVASEVTAQPAGAEGALRAGDYREARRLFEIEYLSRRLREYGDNVTRTAGAIGLERQSLQEKIRKLGILRP